MRIINTWRNPYGEGWSTCRPKKIELIQGLTVLVGCNGAGKSTLLKNIKEELKSEKVPYIMFDNLQDGGSNGISSAAFNENFTMMSLMFTSSEGENIYNNFGLWFQGVRNFIINGKYNSDRKEDRFVEIFRDKDEIEKEREEFKKHHERWLLIDAADSGLSIDNVIEFKDVFNLILEDAKQFDKEVYIIISANEYELVRGENCFDVNTGKYISFNDYEDFRKFIIKSREKKDKRNERE